MIVHLNILRVLSRRGRYRQMKDKEIYMLFSSILGDSSVANESVRQVFSILVKSTLRYRDQMLESRGIVITVQDVRVALDCLVTSLKTGRLPEKVKKERLDLLKLWLDELRCLGNPFDQLVTEIIAP
jgi:hypothetical protein